jgi:uric acid-xanthine permease
MYKNGFCPSAEDGTPLACPDAYGALIGTSACCALILVLISFMPPKMIRKIFPPIVTGPTVMLIGVSLIQSGFEDWLGGSGSCMSRPTSGAYMLCPSVGSPHALPWGSAEYIGLGFSVFVTILICERLGSPIMKSSAVVIGLLVGCIIAAACGYFDPSGINAVSSSDFSENYIKSTKEKYVRLILLSGTSSVIHLGAHLQTPSLRASGLTHARRIHHHR